MSELIEMPYGNGRSLALEFIKAYTEVQLDVEMKRKQCFVNSHCSLDCPNAEYEMADDRYGFGIADDMGLEKVKNIIGKMRPMDYMILGVIVFILIIVII